MSRAAEDAAEVDPSAQPSSVRPDRLTLAAFAGVAVIGGGNAIAVKQSVAELAPFWSAGRRFAVAGLLLVAFVVASRRPFPRGRSLAGAIAYGSIGLGSSFGFVYPALREVPAWHGERAAGAGAALHLGLAIAQRQERFHVRLIGAAIALGGVAIVFADQLSAAVPLVPLLFVLAGTVFIAESGILLKWIPRTDPFATNAVAMLAATLVLLALSVLAGERLALPVDQGTWIAMGHLVLLGSVVMFGLSTSTPCAGGPRRPCPTSRWSCRSSPCRWRRC